VGGKRYDLSSGTKPCAKCGETKPIAEFGVTKYSASGLSSYCKPCMAAEARARRATPEGKRAHYESNLRSAAKTLNDKDGFKTCPKCKVEKPYSEYPKNKYGRYGIATYCLSCSADIVRARRATPEGQAVHRAASKRWREANKERHKDNNARWRYGIDHGTYDAMIIAQDGKCAICQTTDPGKGLARFHIDHCHDSKQVRGLLCDQCNHGLGHFRDNTEFLSRAISYLRSPKGGIES
jgi:hypothetical protein